MSISDNDRIAYLSGEHVGSLTPQERVELDELRTLLAAPATWEDPDPALEERVVRAILVEAENHPRPATTAAPSAPAKPQRENHAARLPRSPFRRPLFALGGFATAVAAAVIVVVLAVSNNGATPLRFAMVVTGTPLAPYAHGSATATKTTSGWEIQLSAIGLPHLANGRYYQAWLKNAAGVLVPVGTFNDALHVTLWSGVPVTQFRTLTVTEQQANGNSASSGRRVLVGTIRETH